MSNLLSGPQVTFTLAAFLGEDMAKVGLLALEAALTCPLEALCGAPVGLHLRHDLLRFDLPPPLWGDQVSCRASPDICFF